MAEIFQNVGKMALPSLRKQLKKADDVPYFAVGEKKTLKARMKAAGLAR